MSNRGAPAVLYEVSVKNLTRRSIPVCCLLGAIALLIPPAEAHHSPAAYDMSTEITVEGSVVAVSWTNPHVYLTLETVGADGVARQQDVEAASVASLQPYGLTRETLQPGSKVSLRGHPPRRAGREMLGLDITLQDGAMYRLHPRGRASIKAATGIATSIEGQWLPPPASFIGLLDAVNTSALTDAATAARGRLDAIAAAQASCAYFPPPQLMVAPYIHVIEVMDDRVIIDIDGVPDRRTVYLDGRAADPAAPPTPFGHSIGYWEDDTLVIESSSFTPHPEGIGFSVPGGSGKRLVERLSLSEDRSQLMYDVIVSDPEYLDEPMHYSTTLDYRPDIALSGEPCDEQTARRFR